jgi:hypothetical protein
VCAGERHNNTLIVALLGAPSRDDLWKETEGLMAFGSKVMLNEEEPIVYLTRADYDAERVTKAAYTKKVKTRGKVKGKRISSKKRVSSDEKKVIKAKYKVKAKKKAKEKNTKVMVKAKKTKKTSIATKGENGNNG